MLGGDPLLTTQIAYAKRHLVELQEDLDDRLSRPNGRVPTSVLAQYFETVRLDVEETEMIAVASLQRFAQTDRRLTAICRRLCDQVAPGLFPPFIVSALSAGYKTLWSSATIQVPAAEECSLLGIVDLMHEAGHWLFQRDRADLVDAEFRTALRRHLASLARRKKSLRQDFTDAEYRRRVAALGVLWLDNWVDEFVCDMLETWVFGGPFAFQHLRLCINHQPELYAPTMASEPGSHPADDLRVSACVVMLERAGVAPAETTGIAAYWERYRDFAKAVGVRRDTYYDATYPDTLITSLADNVITVCQVRGIRRFDSAVPAGDPDLQALAREAWVHFTADPAGYAAWERPTRAALWQQLGV